MDIEEKGKKMREKGETNKQRKQEREIEKHAKDTRNVTQHNRVKIEIRLTLGRFSEKEMKRKKLIICERN